MEDKTQKKLRQAFNIRSTRSRALAEHVPNYKSISKDAIYTALQAKYDEMLALLGTFSGVISLSESNKPGAIFEPTSQIEGVIVKTIHEFSEIVFNQIYNKLFNIQSRTYKNIKINNEIYSADSFRNFKTAAPIIRNYVKLNPIQYVQTTPLLQSENFPVLEDCINTKYNLEHPKLCVFNEVLNHFNSTHKKKKTIDDLVGLCVNQKIELFPTDNIGNIYIYDNVPITLENLIKYGANKDILIHLCEALKIKLNIYEYITDNNQFKLQKIASVTKSRDKALNVILDNNHIYLWKDINTIQRFMKCNTTSSTEYKRKKTKKEYDIIVNNNLSQSEFIKQHTPRFVTIKSGVFNDYTIGNKKYIVKPMTEMQTLYGAEYTGQTPQSVANSYIGEIKKTFMSKEIYDALTSENVKHRTHADTIHPEYFTDGLPNHIGIKKYDLNKAYKHVMKSLDYFYDLDITQTIEPVSELKGDGLYFVESKDRTLLHGNNWYTYEMLHFAFDENIKFKVKYYIKTIRNNQNFKTIIPQIEQEVNHKSVSKLIINSISGLCGVTETTNIQARITTNQNRVFDFITNQKNPYVRKEDDLYLYGFKYHSNFYENRLLIYIQILDQFNMLLYKRIQSAGGLCVARHIDAFYVLNPMNFIHLSDQEGDYKEEEFKPQHIHQKKRDVLYKHNKKNINHTIQSSESLQYMHIEHGAILQGMGGTGKTSAIKRLNLDAIFLAPTNKAALLIGGETIHHFLKINIETNEAIYPITSKSFCVIDEASMITSDLWIHLYHFHMINPHLKYIIMGDVHQLPSIEEIQYKFTEVPLLLDIINYNVITFETNYRQDVHGVKISNQIISGGEVEFQYSAGYADGVNLCYYNNTRRRLNKHFNKKEGIEILLNEDVETYGFLSEGTKVICNKSHKTETGYIFNGEEFEIKSIIDDVIIFTNHSTTTLKNFSSYFTLGYAITIYKAQGSTYEKVNIYDMDTMRSNYRYIYTAVSRATSYNNIKFYKN